MYCIIQFQVVGEKLERKPRERRIGVIYGPVDRLEWCCDWRRKYAPEADIQVHREWRGE